MKKIAFAVSAEYDGRTIDDKLLADFLHGLGFDAKTIIWDKSESSGEDFDTLFVNACWGYHKQPEKFLNWITKLETCGVKIFNPPSVLRWNYDKIYLRNLALSGLKLPSTVWLEKGAAGNLLEILLKNNWQKAVLKPRISATAWRTFVVTPDNASGLQAEFENLLETGGVLIQEFIDEIKTRGEWSFIFFNKEYSHAVLKRTKGDDFRVQSDFGGTFEFVAEPPPFLIKAAQKIISTVEENLLYARVDGIDTGSDFLLMELELIEPLLFLENSQAALERFGLAISRRMEVENFKLAAD